LNIKIANKGKCKLKRKILYLRDQCVKDEEITFNECSDRRIINFNILYGRN